MTQPPNAERVAMPAATTVGTPVAVSEEAARAYLLSLLRVACIEARLAFVEMKATGIALRRGLLTPEEAVAELYSAGVFED